MGKSSWQIEKTYVKLLQADEHSQQHMGPKLRNYIRELAERRYNR